MIKSQSLINSRAARNIYSAEPGDPLGGQQISIADLQPNGGTAPFPVRIVGTWVYSDPSNPGPCVIDLAATQAINANSFQPFTLTLRPGDVFKFPTNSVAVGVATATGRTRLFYGSGPCPFESSYSGHTCALSYFAAAAGGVPTTVAVPAIGILDRVVTRVFRTTGAAETSKLRPRLRFTSTTGLSSPYIYPDEQQCDDIAVAAAGQANTFATWRNIPIPQLVSGTLNVYADTLELDVLDLGNAVANPIQRTGLSDGIFLR